jgi:molybdate transport system substrate-binding protein
MKLYRTWISIGLLGMALAGAARAAETTVAVAANFTAAIEELKDAFEAQSEHRLMISSGSTGQLFAQISNGAPFDVLLSADVEHVDRLIADGRAAADGRFTYAIGKLVLWTRATDRYAPLSVDVLRRDDWRWLAIANPKLAPYGAAAQQALERLGLWTALQPKLVRGESIAQTFAMAETRNADLAFVALAQAIAYPRPAAYVEVPAELYEPIRQDAVLLNRGAANPAAHAFLAFLQSAAAIRVIERFGYAVPGAR